MAKNKEQRVCKLQKSIYGLKHASRSWNICFDRAIKSFGFGQNPDESCVYMKSEGDMVVFMVLYVDNILLLRRDIVMLLTVKVWLAKAIDMKDLGEASYIIRIKLHLDRKNKIIGLSQAAYVDKELVRFAMQDSK